MEIVILSLAIIAVEVSLIGGAFALGKWMKRRLRRDLARGFDQLVRDLEQLAAMERNPF